MPDRMQLQIALDGTLDDARRIMNATYPYVDIAEIGTPLIFREGMAAARTLHAEFPALTLLADLKIMDAGEEEAAIAFEAGCAIATVLGAAHDATIEGAVRAARHAGGRIMADLVRVENPAQRAAELLALGVDLVCVHTAFDVQNHAANRAGLGTLEALRVALPDAPLAIAGGITLDLLDAAAPLHPAVVVVGGAITRAVQPAEAARTLHERIAHHAARA